RDRGGNQPQGYGSGFHGVLLKAERSGIARSALAGLEGAGDVSSLQSLQSFRAQRPAGSSARSVSKARSSTGFTRWASHPASRDWARSASGPQPVKAKMVMPRPQGAARMRRVAS